MLPVQESGQFKVVWEIPDHIASIEERVALLTRGCGCRTGCHPRIFKKFGLFFKSYMTIFVIKEWREHAQIFILKVLRVTAIDAFLFHLERDAWQERRLRDVLCT